MKIAFVILNYNTSEQTEKCIDSILSRIGKNEFRIGLLDNGSSSPSCRKLVEKRYYDIHRRGGCLCLPKAEKISGLLEETI